MTNAAQLRPASTGRRILTQLAVTVALGVVVSLGSAAAGLLPTAAAHSELVSSSPTAGARATAAPPQVALTFSDDVLPQFATVTLSVDDSPAQDVPTRVEKSTVYSTTTPAATNATQEWKIAYRVVSNDGHPITGTITFTVTATTPPNSSATPTASPSPDPAPTTTPDRGSPSSRINYPAAIIPVAIFALVILGPAVVAARRRKEQAAQATPEPEDDARPGADVP